MFGLAYYAGQQQARQDTASHTAQIETEQALLHSKLQLLEMKVDVINEQKDAEELKRDLDQVLRRQQK